MNPGGTTDLTRRGFFSSVSGGLCGAALLHLLGREVRGDSAPVADLKPRPPHFPARAKAVIHLFQNGGPSQVDLFDPKTELIRRQGQKPGDGYVNPVDVKKTGTWLSSPFRFSPSGKSGMELSELIPETAKHADEVNERFPRIFRRRQ